MAMYTSMNIWEAQKLSKHLHKASEHCEEQRWFPFRENPWLFFHRHDGCSRQNKDCIVLESSQHRTWGDGNHLLQTIQRSYEIISHFNSASLKMGFPYSCIIMTGFLCVLQRITATALCLSLKRSPFQGEEISVITTSSCLVQWPENCF